MNDTFVKRIKSLLWRAGMMGLAAVLSYVSSHLGILELSPEVTAVLGLLFGEISKYLNS